MDVLSGGEQPLRAADRASRNAIDNPARRAGLAAYTPARAHDPRTQT